MQGPGRSLGMLLDITPCSIFIFCHFPPHAHDLIFLRWMLCSTFNYGHGRRDKRVNSLCLACLSPFYKESETFPEASHSNFQICLLSRSYATHACPTWNVLREEEIEGKDEGSELMMSASF